MRIYERTDVRCEMEQLRNSLAFHRSKIADKEDKTKRLVTFLSIPYKTAEQGIFGFFFLRPLELRAYHLCELEVLRS